MTGDPGLGRDDEELTLAHLRRCFEGGVPSVIATRSADGIPNVTYLSKVRCVDADRVALSNQFFSKTTANLAEVPEASVVVVDPATYEEYRLHLRYERRDRRGPVFDQLRVDVDTIAALSGMEGVFRLRAADIYRVLSIERLGRAWEEAHPVDRDPGAVLAAVGELTGRISRSDDLDVLAATTVAGIADLLGHEHCSLLLLDPCTERLVTIASAGYEAEGVGSEVALGEGVAGMAAQRGEPIGVGNLRQLEKYSGAVRRTVEQGSQVAPGPGCEVPLPVLSHAQSRLAVPAMSAGEVVGVVLVESTTVGAFGAVDQTALTAVAGHVGAALTALRTTADLESPPPPEDRPPAPAPRATAEAAATHLRFFGVDGSVFLDGDYLIRGVAGRILWSLVGQHVAEGRTDFTNKEVRLDPSLELPDLRDNFESRLILLKRRLDERDAPIRIEKTGRGRFRLVVDGPVRLEPS